MKKSILIFSLSLSMHSVCMEEEGGYSSDDESCKETDCLLSEKNELIIKEESAHESNKPEENYASDIDIYLATPKLHRWCSLNKKSIYHYITLGKRVARKLLEIKQNPPYRAPTANEHSLYLKNIKGLIWFFYSLEPVFNNGVICVNGENSIKFFNYFDIYTKAKQTSPDPTYCTTNPSACTSCSTHFPKQQKIYPQRRIDFRDEKGKLSYDLPSGCSHMLYGKLSATEFFIKIEKYGVYFADVPWHTKNTIGSFCRKIGFPGAGSNDKKHHRKEHLPGWIRSNFDNKVCLSFTWKDTYWSQNKEHPKVSSIKEIIDLCNNYNQHQQTYEKNKKILHINHEELIKLKTLIITTYPYDFDERYGNEIRYNTELLKNHLQENT